MKLFWDGLCARHTPARARGRSKTAGLLARAQQVAGGGAERWSWAEMGGNILIECWSRQGRHHGLSAGCTRNFLGGLLERRQRCSSRVVSAESSRQQRDNISDISRDDRLQEGLSNVSDSIQ